MGLILDDCTASTLVSGSIKFVIVWAVDLETS
jgi:hypothetical protein